MNPFAGQSIEWLEEKLSAIAEALVSTVDSAGSGDSNATERRDRASLERTMAQLRAEIYRQDPDNPKGTPFINTTTPRYL